MTAVLRVSITWRNDDPSTIYNVLKRKLGREPTNAEAIAEVERIKTEGLVERAQAGKLPHQRRR